jgi:HlyD family secretion protein
MNAKPNEESDLAKTLEIDQSSGNRKVSKRWLIVAILAAAVTVVMAFVFWKWSDSSSAVQYKTQEVRRGDLTVIVTATGTLQPTNEVDVGIEVSGTIKTVKVDYNDKVKVGQILAELDISKLEAQVKQSKASLESAKSKVLQAQATVSETRIKLAQFRRVQKLSNNRVPSQTEIDAAEAAFERALANEASAKADVSQSQATLDINQTDLYKAVIRSPVNGVVLTRSVEPGQTVAASFTTPVLFKLAEDLTKMDLHVNVDEADVGQIQEGQKATFSVAAYPNRTFEARIIQARYGSSTTSGVVTYETVLKVDNSELLLRPGMTATADIIVKKIKKAVLIPSAALRFTPPIQEEKKPSGSLIGAILPHPPSAKSQQREDTVGKKEKRIWTLSDGKLSDVWATIGAANGGMTEVVAGDLQPGMAVVVDTVNAVK